MTMFMENVRLALASLRSNKSRTLLTMLGIIIGIAAVIAIETVGNSLTLSVSDSMQSMGANNITVYVTARTAEKDESEDGIVFGTTTATRDMTEDDYLTNEMIVNLKNQFSDEIEAISADESVGSNTVEVSGNSRTVSVTGVSQGYFTANSFNILAGSLISAEDSANASNVVLVDSSYVDELYDGDYDGIIGETLSIDLQGATQEFTIVGVYEYQQSMFSMGSTKTSTVYIPLSTAQNINHTKNYYYVQVVSAVGVDSDALATKIKTYLNGFYRSNKYYYVDAYSMASMISTLTDMMGKITTAISIVAAIALLVGGIGVMNIMLVSITERTREIGTRKALGATNGYIRQQFIIEAVIICIIGGIIGIILGIVLGSIGASILGFSASPTLKSILMSLGFSMAIGIFFGYYPANKAAKMNPIDALRYE